jgi:hypothetical protein
VNHEKDVRAISMPRFENGAVFYEQQLVEWFMHTDFIFNSDYFVVSRFA